MATVDKMPMQGAVVPARPMVFSEQALAVGERQQPMLSLGARCERIGKAKAEV